MERDKHEVGSLLLSKTVVPNLGVGTQEWRHTMNPKGRKIIERDNEEKTLFLLGKCIFIFFLTFL